VNPDDVAKDAQDALDDAGHVLQQAERVKRESRYGLPKFRCPFCEEVTTSKILDGRPEYKGGYYWRRHRCDECGEKYTTKEIVEPLDRPSLIQHLVA
jgi:transcription elongation factor Elf1